MQGVNELPGQEPAVQRGRPQLLMQQAQLLHGVVGGVGLLDGRGRGRRGAWHKRDDGLPDVEVGPRERNFIQEFGFVFDSLSQHAAQMFHAELDKYAESAVIQTEDLLILPKSPFHFVFVAVVDPFVHLSLHGVACGLHAACRKSIGMDMHVTCMETDLLGACLSVRWP